MVPKWRDSIKSCGLVGVDVLFLQEVCDYEDRFEDIWSIQAQ